MKKLTAVLTAVAVAMGSASFAAEIPDEGLLLHYEFNSAATDSSGNGNDGALMDGAVVSDGMVYFNGSGAYVDMPDGLVKDCEDITVSMYVKPEITNANQFTWTFGNNNTVYMFLGTCNAGGKLKAEITTKSWNDAQTLDSAAQLPAGEWSHVVFTINNGTASIYRDGTVVQSRAVTLTPKDLGATTQNYLAKSQYNDPYFRGYISDFRVYSTALTEERIAEIGKECAEEVAVAFPTIAFSNRITDDIKLPSVNESGASITWTSGDSSVITDDGRVTRPAYGEGRKIVQLTASIEYNGEKRTKTYNVTVLPETSDEEYGYLLAYFTGNNPAQEQMSYALSKNGYDFFALNSSAPVFKAAGGTLCLRDPYIFKGQDGKYYCLATDMRSANGWASQSTIFTWESTDLIHWTNERIIDFKQFSGFESCNRAWAPQAIWCPEKEQYMIYLALSAGGPTHMYRCYTDDFTSCTEPELMYDFSADAIDGDIVGPVDGKYYMYFKYDRNGGVISLFTADSLSGEWTDTGVDLPKENMAVEGSAAYKLIGENRWNNLVDCYGNGRFMCLETTDLLNSTILKYGNSAETADYYLDMYEYGAVPRHGSVITVSRAEFEAIEAAFNGSIYPEQQEPILHYSFDDDSVNDDSGHGNNGVLKGGSFAEGRSGGRALSLNGNGDYVELPAGIIAGVNDMTVAAWVKMSKDGDYQRLVDMGVDESNYFYISPYTGGKSNMTIRIGRMGGEQTVRDGASAPLGQWVHYAAVLKNNRAELYINGVLVGSSDEAFYNPADLGWTLNNYIGKSLFSRDPYFGGLIDEFYIYNRALSNAEIGALAETDGTTVVGVSGENVKSFNTIIDAKNKTVQIAVVPGHISAVEPVFEFTNEGTVTEPSGIVDLSEPVVYTVTDKNNNSAQWTVSAVEWGNSVLGQYGLFGDPNIIVMNGKYYIYPTTDGTSGWRSTYFKTFSSTDLVHWQDEGTILDLNDVPWSSGVYGWAPTITERGGKYYYYYSSGNKVNGHKDLAVAVADDPAGPFVDKGEPLVPGGNLSGQMIDSHVFIDDDGTPYLFWGNGQLYVARLNEDMVSFAGEIKNITPSHFTEAIFVIKRGGKYYFTWSEGNTENADYQVRYGVADSPMERPSGDAVILSQNNTNDSRIQCTAHHSIINIPGTDDWYICYHRFNIPTTVNIGNGRYAGSHREVAIDKLEFDENGNIKVVTATLEGITEPVHFGNHTTAVVEDFSNLKAGDSFNANVTVQNNDGAEKLRVIFAMYGAEGELLSADVKEIAVDKYSGVNFTQRITLTADGSDAKLKIMTWDGEGNMRPVSDVIKR